MLIDSHCHLNYKGLIEDQPAYSQLRLKSPALGEMSSTHLGDTSKPTPEEHRGDA